MNIADMVQSIRSDGVTMTLAPSGELKAVGNAAAVQRWLPNIRAHKPDIVAYLQSEDAAAAVFWRWWIHFADRKLEVAILPESTCAEAMALYPGATKAEPINDNDTEVMT